MRQTSLLAYQGIKGKLSPKQTEVYNAIYDTYPTTDKELAKHLGWPINTITPRRNELFKKGRVVEAYIRKDINGRKATFWKPKVIGGFYDEVA